jgi:dTDP-4-dehydrorhamnose 3,5-epimerase
MDVRELAVPDAFEFAPRVFPDSRGLFVCPFQEDDFVKAVGHPLKVAQMNHSRSRRGTIRGVHFTDVAPGQAKYVYCPQGALLDVVVDIRVGSPTFGVADAVRLDPAGFRAVYVPAGLGHAIMALEDDTVLSYLCSTTYDPHREHGLDPLDPELDLPWPADVEPLLSDKDRAAPSLDQAREVGLLPRYDECLAYYQYLRESCRA